MHIAQELIEAAAGLGIMFVIGMVAVIAILIVGAAIRGTSPRAGTALAMLGLSLPVLAISVWLIQRGAFELQMTRTTEPVRKVHVMKMFRGERPSPGWIQVKGVARYEFGAQMKMASIFVGKLSTTYCYPVTPPTRMRKAPLVACSRGREPGGEAEDIVLTGIIGASDIPPQVRQIFQEKSNIEIAPDAMRLDEGVPEPSTTRAYLLIGLGIVLGLLMILVAGLVLRRRPDTDG